MPRGGFQRAVPRDVLTGEPIRPDTVHKRVRPDPRDQRDTGPHTQRKRGHHARVSQTQTRPTRAVSHMPLPVLHLDDLTDVRDNLAAADAQERDSTADVEERQVADGE
jgi:hypothetical protein